MDAILLDIGTWREVAAWFALAMIVVLLVASKALIKYSGSDADERRQIRAIRPALARARGHTVTTRDIDADETFRTRVRNALLHDEPPDEVTVRRAVDEVRATISEATPQIPVVVVRGLVEAAAFLLLGLLVFSSLGVWERVLDPDPDLSTGGAIQAGVWLYAQTVDVLMLFPHAETVAAMLTAAGIMTANAIWGAWLVIAVYLFVGAVAIWVLEPQIERANDTIERTPPSIPRLAKQAGLVFLAGVAVAVPLRLVGLGVADSAGLVVALLVWLYVSAIVSRVLSVAGTVWSRLSDRRQVVQLLGPHEPDRGTDPFVSHEVSEAITTIWGGWEPEPPKIYIDDWMGGGLVDTTEWSPPPRREAIPEIRLREWLLVLGRDGYAVSATLLAPFLVAYLGYFVASGRAVEVGGVLASAPATSQLGLVLLVIAGVMGVLRGLGDAGQQLKQSVGRAFRSFSVRTWMFTRGIPIAGAVVVGLGAAAFVGQGLRSALLAIVGGTLIAGITLRFVGEFWMRAKYRTIRRASERSGDLREVVTEPYTIHDADGDPIYVADVAGTRLAHRDPDQLVDDVVATAEHLLTEGGTTGDTGWVGSTLDRALGDGVLATESRYYAKQLEHGVTDPAKVRKRLRSDVRTRARRKIADAGGRVGVAPLEERLAREYPDPTVDDQLVELQRRGEIEKQQDRYILKTDPRAFGG